MQHVEPGKVLGMVMTLFTLTEFYLFAGRLIQNMGVNEDVHVETTLMQAGGRNLVSFDPDRVPFDPWHSSPPDLVELPRKQVVSATELIAHSSELALDHAIWIFERFNWDAPRGLLADDQQKLIERRL